MNKSTAIIVAAASGFISIVADQITYQTEKKITSNQEAINFLDDKLVQNLNYWSANIQVHKDFYYDINNSLLDLNMAAINKHYSNLKARQAWNPNTDIGEKMLEIIPPNLTDDDWEKLIEDFSETLQHTDKMLDFEMDKLVFQCREYLYEIGNCLKFQISYQALKKTTGDMNLIDSNDIKVEEIGKINNAYFDDYLLLFNEVKMQKRVIASLNFRRQLLIIISVIFNMIAIISLLFFFRQNVVRTLNVGSESGNS